MDAGIRFLPIIPGRKNESKLFVTLTHIYVVVGLLGLICDHDLKVLTRTFIVTTKEYTMELIAVLKTNVNLVVSSLSRLKEMR